MGPDELRARQLLLDMQNRLGRDPFEALGLSSSDPGDVRTAFLRLTKIYHPARFARMASEIQRLANEVFLALRATHDALVRPQVKPPAARATGMIPVLRPPPAVLAANNRLPTGSYPVTRPSPLQVTTSPARPGTDPVARTPSGRTPTLGTPIVQARPTTGTAPATPGQPAFSRPGSQSTQPTSPMRPTAPQPPTQPQRPTASHDPARPSRLPSSSPPPPTSAAARPSGATPASSAGDDPELAVIEQLLAEDRLTDARMKLETLVARKPGVPRHQALIHYAKGREAQLAGRRDEARLQLLDALDLVGDLQLANTALGELLSKRK